MSNRLEGLSKGKRAAKVTRQIEKVKAGLARINPWKRASSAAARAPGGWKKKVFGKGLSVMFVASDIKDAWAEFGSTAELVAGDYKDAWADLAK